LIQCARPVRHTTAMHTGDAPAGRREPACLRLLEAVAAARGGAECVRGAHAAFGGGLGPPGSRAAGGWRAIAYSTPVWIREERLLAHGHFRAAPPARCWWPRRLRHGGRPLRMWGLVLHLDLPASGEGTTDGEIGPGGQLKRYIWCSPAPSVSWFAVRNSGRIAPAWVGPICGPRCGSLTDDVQEGRSDPRLRAWPQQAAPAHGGGGGQVKTCREQDAAAGRRLSSCPPAVAVDNTCNAGKAVHRLGRSRWPGASGPGKQRAGFDLRRLDRLPWPRRIRRDRFGLDCRSPPESRIELYQLRADDGSPSAWWGCARPAVAICQAAVAAALGSPLLSSIQRSAVLQRSAGGVRPRSSRTAALRRVGVDLAWPEQFSPPRTAACRWVIERGLRDPAASAGAGQGW